MAKIDLNAKKLEALKPASKRADYFDSNLPGFFVRVTPAGVKTFGVMYRHAGRLRRFTIGTTDQWTLVDARDKAREAIRAAAKGEQDMAATKKEQRKAESFGELAADYMERWAKKRKRTWAEDQRIIDVYLNPKLENIRATAVKRADIRTLLEALADNSPIMANRTLACIRKIYNWGISADLLENNPCYKLMAPGEEQRRDRVLSDDELKKLWKALEAETSSVADTYKLRLLTLQRGGEVLSMKWADLDLEAKWWTIPGDRSKNGLPHRVWLSDSVLRILERIQANNQKRKKRAGGPSLWVFPGKRKGQPLTEPKRVKAAIAEAAGIADWTGHDLRRTAASFMTSMGIPRLVVGRILNHAEPEVTATYDRHSYDTEKKDALDRWAKRLAVIVSDLKEAGPSSSAG